MSGHSKFANIKHKKEKADSTKGKIFTRIGREIAVAVKSGGSDPSSNSKLRDAIAAAKASNMPNDTIDRSIKKAAGDLSSVNYEHATYEGYGPCGVAIIVDALTDNRNRTAANVRNAFTKGSGNMGTTGCVSYLFDEKGLIMVEKLDSLDDDEFMLMVADEGVEDFIVEEEGYEIQTAPEDFSNVREFLEKSKIPMVSAEITKIPQKYVALNDPDDVKKMRKILDLLDEEDDVQHVYHNWENEDE